MLIELLKWSWLVIDVAAMATYIWALVKERPWAYRVSAAMVPYLVAKGIVLTVATGSAMWVVTGVVTGLIWTASTYIAWDLRDDW